MYGSVIEITVTGQYQEKMEFVKIVNVNKMKKIIVEFLFLVILFVLTWMSLIII